MAAVAALAVARAARAQVQALRPTAEQQQAEIERVQQRALEFGMVEKTAGKSGVAGSMQRGWKKWMKSPLGAQAAARVTAGESPVLEDMKAYQTYKYLNRETYSSVGRQGCGDSVGSLQKQRRKLASSFLVVMPLILLFAPTQKKRRKGSAPTVLVACARTSNGCAEELFCGGSSARLSLGTTRAPCRWMSCPCEPRQQPVAVRGRQARRRRWRPCCSVAR